MILFCFGNPDWTTGCINVRYRSSVVSQSGPARETRRISPMMMIFYYAIIRSSRPYTFRLFLRIYDLILGMALTSCALSLPFSRFRWTFWRYDEALPSTERPMPFVFLEVLQLYTVFRSNFCRGYSRPYVFPPK